MLSTVEQLAKEHKIPAWLMAAARVKFGWAIGKELTEEEFLESIDATRNHSAQ